MFSLGYNIKQAFKQIFRNRGMSLASILSIIAMLLILGLFFVLTVNLNLFTEVVKTEFDQIELFLDDNIGDAGADSIMRELNQYKGIADLEYRTKEDALKIMKERWGESGYLLDSLGSNPLPASIVVEVDSLENAVDIAERAKYIDGVDEVLYYRETVEKLTKITHFLQVGALIIMGFLVVVSVVVVSNTIKLTVFARAKEIHIMKYVGATNWFIRGPFIVEGIIIGVIAAVLSSGLIAYIYEKLLEAIGPEIIAISSVPLVSVTYLSVNMVVIFLALGASIGAWGSIVSMRRFLDT